MTNNEFVGEVSNYIQSIMYYDWDGECYCQSRPCPFESFEEAIAAYELHMKRVENRSYLTIDERRHYELGNEGGMCNLPAEPSLQEVVGKGVQVARGGTEVNE